MNELHILNLPKFRSVCYSTFLTPLWDKTELPFIHIVDLLSFAEKKEVTTHAEMCGIFLLYLLSGHLGGQVMENTIT